jgi:metallo-beta-lactamase family protein
MQIQFLGAADTVTGSKHLVTVAGVRMLLDCGMFQGYKALRERNWQPLPVAARDIDLVVLSHAHLDHSGWLPRLVADGFRGTVHASPASCDLAEVLLLDSAHLQEEDARRANRMGYSKHAPAQPLYTRADARRAIARLQPTRVGKPIMLADDIELRLTPAGHLLGACSVHLRMGDASLLFSGDLGRRDDLLMPPPAAAPAADVLLIEATYGNRLHPPEDAQARLGGIVRDTIGRGGSVLLPAFAVGRAQALLLVLQRLKAAGEIPQHLPIVLDSPMAAQATQLYRQHRRQLRVREREIANLVDGVRIITSAAQSQRATHSRMPAVIISASGMATGGRVLGYLAAMAPDPRHHIVFAGFQVGGSRGALMTAGAREIKLRGEYIPVRAQVSQLEGFSGHADADELMDWMRQLPHPPRQTFVVHGEAAAADALRLRIQDELGWSVRVPQHQESVTV